MIPVEFSIYIIGMAFIRAGAFTMSIPFLGGKQISKNLRVGIALMIGISAYGTIVADASMPSHILLVFLTAMKEAVIGLLLGLAVKIVFFIVEFAGHVIANEIGLAMSSNFNPMSGTQSTVIGSILYYFVVMLFLITNTHHEMIKAFISSFEIVPIGVSLGVSSFHNLIRGSTDIFVVGLQISAPIVALNFIINLAFAVLGKAAPKINVFMISFGVRILAGLGLILMTVSVIAQYLNREVVNTPFRMLEFLIS